MAEKQLISPNYGSGDNVAGNGSLSPTIKGTNSGLKGPDLEQRTRSSNAQDEKIFEPAKGGNMSRP